MILEKVLIQNVKTYYKHPEIIFDNKLNIFVGQNAGGKSNLFEIIQGVLGNIIFKHITLQYNQNKLAENNQHKGKTYILNNDQINQLFIQTDILDPNFKHLSESSSIDLYFKITPEDIKVLDSIIKSKTRLIEYLNKNVSNSQQLQDVINQIELKDLEDLENKKIIISILKNGEPNIINASEFKDISVINRVFSLIRNLNVICEISTVVQIDGVAPFYRYFPPHRNTDQQLNPQYIEMSNISNYEDSFTKGMNITKDANVSFVSAAYQKLCFLYEFDKNDLIKKFNLYLNKYLKAEIKIDKDKDNRFRPSYNLKYVRLDGLPMKLSSGEKEFFNLITGLILSGLRNGLVLIDEPELHLHFQWQQVLLNLIFELSKEFGLQFFIVTHSPKLINTKTLPFIHRIRKKDQYYSEVIKPNNIIIEENETKDLIQFLTTTNNEKAFFTEKVVLVEGITDLIIMSRIIELLKTEKKSEIEIEIEVISVESKNNLFKIRNLLNCWKIDNYIMADLDFLKNLLKDREQLSSGSKQLVNILTQKISSILAYSEKKLKEILWDKDGEDGKKFLALIANKGNMDDSRFCSEINSFINYLITQRAVKINTDVLASADINNMFVNLITNDKLLILSKGTIENYFKKKDENKVTNAIEITKLLNLNNIPTEIKDFILKML